MSYRPRLPTSTIAGEAKFDGSSITVSAAGQISLAATGSYGWTQLKSISVGASQVATVDVTSIPTTYQQYLCIYNGINFSGQGILNLSFSPDNLATIHSITEYVIYCTSATTNSSFDWLAYNNPFRIAGNYVGANTGRCGYIYWADLGSSGAIPVWTGSGSNVATQYQTFSVNKGMIIGASSVNSLRFASSVGGTTLSNGAIYIYGA